SDDRAFLAELIERMDVGATLLLTVPALNALWSEWDVALGHYRRYSAAALRARLTVPGLAVEAGDYPFPEMPAPAPVRQALRRRSNGAAAAAPTSGSPAPPPLADAMLYRVGLVSLRFRGVWPAGTSLLAVARRTP